MFERGFVLALLASSAAGFAVQPLNPLALSRSAAQPLTHAPGSRLRMKAVGPKMVATPLEDQELYKGTETLGNDLLVRIDDQWYDLSRWRKAHPAGTHWIDLYKNQDATEVMYAFHSDTAQKMIERLPKAKEAPKNVPAPSQTTMNFRKWRQELIQEGWFNRDWRHEAFNVGSWFAWMGSAIVLSTMFSASLPAQIAACMMLSVANTQAGWLGHDYVHGRGKWCTFMRNFGAVAGGLGTTWWSDKHNLHHARTNEVGKDEDLMVDPALWLWAPAPENDAPWRKYQGIYAPLPMSLLFMIWRFDSVKVALQRKLWPELAGFGIHYAAMLSLFSLPVFIGSVFVSGLMTAIITTVTHQSEEMFYDEEPEFVDGQFRSTRDAVCSNPFSEWLWGGMQYQLEHHLFPTMPRYKYPALVPHVKKFAEENNLEFRITPEFELLKLNIDLYTNVAALPAAEGAKSSRKDW